MKDDKVYLTHILECIKYIQEFTHSGKVDFYKSKLIQDAVIRNLEIIGEASEKISIQLKHKENYIPWREMSGLRDVLIHDYFGVDVDIIWNVVTKELPKIKDSIERIIKEI